MIKKIQQKITLLFLLLLLNSIAIAQSIAPQSINAAGNKLVNSSGSLVFTLGDLLVIPQSNAGGVSLSNGFMYSAVNPIINTGALSTSAFCAGASVTIPYTASVAFSVDNVFTVQLSDASGSFSNPISIGTVTDTISGSINALIPANAVAGSAYRIRVVASSPVVTGFDNGNDLSIHPAVQFTASASVTDCGNNSGFIRVDNIASGTAPFTYLLNNNPATPVNSVFQNIQGGNYALVINDNNSCSDTLNFNIAQVQPVNISFTSSNTQCAPLQNASVTASANGGTAPYQFSWLVVGINASTLNITTAGDYTCYVSDQYGCSALQNINIASPQVIQVSVSGINTECGFSTGSATANASGGTTPYIYQWSSGSQQALATNLTSGQYVVQVYDANRCNGSASINIIPNNGPAISLVSLQNASCYDAQNGSLTVSVSGGVSPYTYFWTTGNTTSELNNMPPGYYDLTLTDAANCQVSASFEIQAPPIPQVTFSTTLPDCGTANGAISTQVTGGLPPFSYQWSVNAGGVTTNNITNVLAGFYYLELADANNCRYYQTAQLSNSSNSLTISVNTITPSDCRTIPSGAVDISVSGGSGNYTYNWSNGSSQEDLSNVRAGTYFVTATDVNQCVGVGSAIVPSMLENSGFSQQLCIVTVDSTNSQNLIIWEKQQQEGINSFRIYRESASSNYQLLATVPFANLSEYYDPYANEDARSWRYKITAVDSCDEETPFGTPHKTIHLVQNANANGGNDLSWDFYDGSNYDKFYIWRDDPSTGWVIIDSLANNVTSYTDWFAPSIDARYMIEVSLNNSCESTLRQAGYPNSVLTTVVKSKSNIRNNRQSAVAIKNQPLKNNDLKVYPNPATNTITIELSNLQHSNLQPTITIESMLGQLLYQSKHNQNRSNIDISNFQSGVYLVKVLTEEGLMVKSIVVER